MAWYEVNGPSGCSKRFKVTKYKSQSAANVLLCLNLNPKASNKVFFLHTIDYTTFKPYYIKTDLTFIQVYILSL